MKRYYIAYGSNLNISQMRHRCPEARIIGTGWINDYHLLYRGSKTGAYLTIEPMEGARVPVAAWEVTGEDETRLDLYEGYPNFYYKKELMLNITGIRSRKVRRRACFVYIMHEDRPVGIPQQYYINTCREGYEDFGFDQKYLKEALDYSWRGIKWETIKK